MRVGLKLRDGGAISPCKWCSGGGIHTKANGLWLEDYILHLLSTLPERFDADPDADIDDLLPWNDAVKASLITL